MGCGSLPELAQVIGDSVGANSCGRCGGLGSDRGGFSGVTDNHGQGGESAKISSEPCNDNLIETGLQPGCGEPTGHACTRRTLLPVCGRMSNCPIPQPHSTGEGALDVRAVQITEFGGPEVLTLTDLPEPTPGTGQVLIDVSRAGVNYADTHQIENFYFRESTLPMVPGAEVVGRTSDGRRVLAVLNEGGYAEKAVAAGETVFDIPEKLDDVSALGLMIQGTTAWLLLRQSTHFEPGESVVVHAAAGGVGSLAVQLAKSLGAGRVIASASTPEKRDLALELGADVAIDPASEDLTATILDANNGKQVDVVLEMTGGQVTDQSLAALAPFGRLAMYGLASREPAQPVELPALMSHSTTVSGFWLVNAFSKPGLVQTALENLAGAVLDGKLRVISGGDYPLSEARRAHEDLLARRTMGKLVLDPRA